MIRVDINESFPITVALIDESTGTTATGKTVYYDLRKQPGDVSLSPAIEGILPESSLEPGIYRIMSSVPESGSFLVYATCSGFITNVEEIIVNEENIYELTKQNRHYNISIEDVIRENATPTASQTARNVPLGLTDYIVTRIKGDSNMDWTGTTVSGVVYAHYKTTSDPVPYMMGGPF